MYKNHKKTTLRQNITNPDRNWIVIDAAGKRIGQVATVAADHIRGKNRPDYTPHTDGGAFVIILNAEKIEASGTKEENKKYYRHSGYIGHLKTASLKEVRAKTPTRILFQAISGMLPKNKLRKQQMRRLRLVIGDQNPHQAQNPKSIEI